ncbi:hypothetical protein BSKO_04145 [Bryopsis sp. KO-2023]|nr:hypothetical protein BSKO_04145 [Bryopsis sp. KO-2023]
MIARCGMYGLDSIVQLRSGSSAAGASTIRGGGIFGICPIVFIEMLSRPFIVGAGNARPTNRVRLTTAAMKVEKWDVPKNGPASRSNIVSKLRKEGYQTMCYTFHPGTIFPDHSHGCDKKDSIISGKFLFRMDGETVVLEPGDMVEVPAGVTHYAEVVGDDPVEFVDASKV